MMGSTAMEEYDLLGDSKYRSYMTQVDRALKGFESTAEWADLIAALTKLNKVLLAHMKFPIIPRRILISKRLAQCMHPALPSGVHQKALETYDIIFKCMGTNRLAAELFIYSAGLFPLLANAAMTVRSALLTVYETHFVPLGERLRPGLNGFLSGVLPGLEEGSDHYTRTNNLLEAVAEAVELNIFYSSLWECVATNATIRLPALTFVLAHCSKRGRGQQAVSGMDHQLHLLGTDHDVMCRALCLALRDSSALVQRSALDLLLLGFPIHQPQFVSRDMVGLVTSVLTTLLRRDMSLNRRLFNWLLGSEINPDLLPESHPVARRSNSTDGNCNGYFLAYSQDLVVDAVLSILETSVPLVGSNHPLDIKPYRIITTLLDKPEIGPVIIDRIILDIFRTLHHMSLYLVSSPEVGGPSRQELIKTANLLFAQLETSYVWTSCGDHFTTAATKEGIVIPDLEQSSGVAPIGSGPTGLGEICKLITFLLEVVSIETYVETSSEHLPELFQVMVKAMSASINYIPGQVLAECLNCLRKVLARVQPAWNVWDVGEKKKKKKSERNSISEVYDTDVAKEVTESNPGSPLSTLSSKTGGSSESPHTQDIKDTDVHHESLVLGCKQEFTDLFQCLVKSRILLNPPDSWNSLVMDKNNMASTDRKEGLLTLLDQVIRGSDTKNKFKKHEPGIQESTSLREGASDCEGAFAAACTSLVELSSMPKYNQDGFTSHFQGSEEDLPPWLLGLLICCTLGSNQEDTVIKLQLTAVSTLVELASVLRSAMAARKKTRTTGEGGSVLVTMEPLLTETQLEIIVNRTTTVQLVTDRLWAGLGHCQPSHHLRCVTLLHRLLALAPDPDQVEAVVATSLQLSATGSSVGVYRRFAQLWHLSRDITSAKRTLDLCLFKMLAGLKSEQGAVRALAQRWVEHCMARGDTGRLLEPLLLSLLDPASARVSVLHAKINQSTPTPKPTPESSPRMPKIFAISSTDNNLIFHVSNNELLPSSLSPRHKIQVMTRSNGLTVPLMGKQVELPVSHSRFPYTDLSMWVNPFALVSSESEFNHDPSTTPEPPPASGATSISTSSSSSSAPSLTSTPEVARRSSNMSQKEVVRRSSNMSQKEVARRSSNMSQKEALVLCPSHLAHGIVAELLQELIDQAVDKSTSPFCLKLEDLTFASLASTTGEDSEPRSETSQQVTVHPLHSHLLLYCRQVDSRAALHTLSALHDIISVHPRLAVSSLSTTSITSPSLTRSTLLVQLLARHRRSVFGKGFSSTLPPDSTASYRSSMLLEVVISLSLYFLRSYYPSLPGLSKAEVLGNRELQLASVSLLSKIASELVLVVKENGKSFALYMNDLLTRCKVQKVVLHSLLSGVHSLASIEHDDSGFTEEVLEFNDGETVGGLQDSYVNTEAFQVELLKLVLSLVMLEEVINTKRFDDGVQPRSSHLPSTVLKYQPDAPLSEQPMFLAAVLAALRQSHLRDLHHHWTGLIVSCLPFLGAALTQVVTSVAAQIWTNLESLAFYTGEAAIEDLMVPSDYVLTQLESLGQLLSYCLMDSSQSGGVSPNPFPSSNPNPNQPNLMANLVHVFGGPSSPQQQSCTIENMKSARRALLSTIPRLVASLATLWAALSSSPATPTWLVGSSKAVKNTILDLLSPLATVHPTHFLAAVSVAWAEQETRDHTSSSVTTPSPSPGQTVLVELTSSLKMFPTTTVISTLRQVVKSPPLITGLPVGTSLDLSALQFFSAYLSASPASQLSESWGSLKELLKDCSSQNLRPPSVFLALSILHQFVLRGGAQGLERKDSRDLQEMTCKLVETISTIAGSRLEAGTWLRGTRTVRTDLDIDSPGPVGHTGSDVGTEAQVAGYAVAALNLLAQLLSTLLDIIYQSEEKEKVLPLLTTVMYNLAPYLRHHSANTLPLLRAGSSLLASLSEYQFTRRAWKKEGMELLLDPAFFQLDHETLRYWRTTTDNLMTHDKTTFKDLLARIASLGQSNINLFSSKELEQEQRALLLKRLAFVIFCSDIDQYQKQMPDITDRLSECLRTVPVSPAVQAAVFLCFRVILLRMSAVHVTFLWPVIITEMVLIFSSMEHELSLESAEFSAHLARVSQLDPSWVAAAAAGPGLGLQNTSNSPAWLGVYLAVCKLLDQAASLPASLLPQFQMYRWAFVREGEAMPAENKAKVELNNGPGVHHDFVPHIVRIYKLMEVKLGRSIPPRPIVAGEPLLTMRSISSLTDLGPWFSTLSLSLTRQQTRSMQNMEGVQQRSPVGTIERIIELDFLEEIVG